MSDTITLYTRNILETGTVTVTGTPDTGFLESRLYDRHVSFYWKVDGTQASTFHVNQGASDNKAIDFLAIEGHNFDGEDMQWQYSTDDSSWSDATTDWSQSGNSQIIKTLGSSQTKQYWRVTVASMQNPRCCEIFMSYGYEFDVRVQPRSERTEIDNVSWRRTVGGLERSTKFGDTRRVRSYGLQLDSTDLTSFRAAMDDLDEYSKPFFIKDDEGDYFMCRLSSVPVERPLTGRNDYKEVAIEVIEQL